MSFWRKSCQILRERVKNTLWPLANAAVAAIRNDDHPVTRNIDYIILHCQSGQSIHSDCHIEKTQTNEVQSKDFTFPNKYEYQVLLTFYFTAHYRELY